MSQALQRLCTVVAGTLVAVLLAAPAAPASALPDRYIVVLDDDVRRPGDIAAEHRRRHGVEPTHVYGHALSGYAARIPAARLSAVRGDTRVAYVAPDRRVEATAQSLPTGIDRSEGDVSSASSGNGSGAVPGPGVAVIDSGVSAHPDLNLAGGRNCTSGNARDYKDSSGHGTHVAGIIGAKDDGTGVVGMAPGVPLYGVRILNKNGSGTLSEAACGVDWVAANSDRIKVANMSVRWFVRGDDACGATNDDPLHKAICTAVNVKGVTIVAGAGNEGQSTTYSPRLENNSPASYDEVLTVTAIADFDGRPGGGAPATCRADVDDTAADYSSYTSSDSPDAAHTIAAPGTCITSTSLNNGYRVMSGTSMASPTVAGAAALCLSPGGRCAADPAPRAVMGRLLADARAASMLVPPADPAYFGFGGDPNSGTVEPFYGDLLTAGGL